MRPNVLLRALQLADSALPIGRFAHSLGVESWLSAFPSAGEDELRELAASFVREAVAPLDGVAVAHAHRARSLAELVELDRVVSACKLVREARQASVACGRQLARLAPRLTADPLALAFASRVEMAGAHGNVAVVNGALGKALGLAERDVVVIELRNAAWNVFSCAIRLGRLSPTQAQALVVALDADIVCAAEDAVARGVEEMHSTAPELELSLMLHSQRDVRLFIT